MANIIWLDDQPGQVRGGIEALRSADHNVTVLDSEEQVVAALDSGFTPDLLIQDLQRPSSTAHIRGGAERFADGRFDSFVGSGWRFYKEVLRPYFPQVGVIICTFDADFAVSLKQTDDFNVVIIPKKEPVSTRIVPAVAHAMASRMLLHAAANAAPQVVAVDFDKVSSALIKHLAAHPTDLHRVSWAAFEQLVEQLLRELGYEVLHTRLTRDGGADLWAVFRGDLGEILYAIDAKKYAPDRLVGPEPVRAIYGVADMAGASAGMIVTTSRFGPAALRLAEQYRYRVALKDFEGVSDWLRLVTGSF